MAAIQNCRYKNWPRAPQTFLAIGRFAVYEWGVMKKLIPLFLALAGALSVHAKIVTQTVEYQQGDTTLEGWLAYDDSPPKVHRESMEYLKNAFESTAYLNELQIKYTGEITQLTRLERFHK
jgi:hypothetical protein